MKTLRVYRSAFSNNACVVEDESQLKNPHWIDWQWTYVGTVEMAQTFYSILNEMNFRIVDSILIASYAIELGDNEWMSMTDEFEIKP